MAKKEKPQFHYTREEKEYITQMYGLKTKEELAKELGKSIESICSFIERNRITKITFSISDDEYLINNFQTTSYKEMAEHLGKTYYQTQRRIWVLRHRYNLGLKKTKGTIHN